MKRVVIDRLNYYSEEHWNGIKLVSKSLAVRIIEDEQNHLVLLVDEDMLPAFDDLSNCSYLQFETEECDSCSGNWSSLSIEYDKLLRLKSVDANGEVTEELVFNADIYEVRYFVNNLYLVLYKEKGATVSIGGQIIKMDVNNGVLMLTVGIGTPMMNPTTHVYHGYLGKKFLIDGVVEFSKSIYDNTLDGALSLLGEC